jgi:hypothetical protein
MFYKAEPALHMRIKSKIYADDLIAVTRFNFDQYEEPVI